MDAIPNWYYSLPLFTQGLLSIAFTAFGWCVIVGIIVYKGRKLYVPVDRE